MMKKWFALMIALSVLVIGLVACGSSEDSSNEPSEEPETSDSEEATGEASGTLEIFSWWTGAGEEDGLLALIELFEEKHPEIEVDNAAVAGGAGTNAKAVLTSRMQGNDPPGTFQVHGGAELNDSWVAAGQMDPLNDLFEAEGWADKFPEELIELVSKDGNIYSVPVNIHRGNVLWYNTEIFEEHGLEVPTTFEEFFDVADALQEAGVTPLALGDREPWAATHLFETVLLGTLGADDYNKLWSGEVGMDDPRVEEAAEIFIRMLDYVNEDHSSRNWQDASQLVAQGEAAMNVMGDWAKGYFVNDLNLAVKEDFGWAATPGTEGTFMVITDTFGLPTGVENPEVVKSFLAVLGSQEGQDAFNPLKGSIPARVDADVSKYDEYGQETIEDFKSAELSPSLAHGSAANEGFLTQVNQAINIFVTQKDVDSFVDSLKQYQP
ncbi:ABC transporter substrate-binding protein [Halalkalibacterium halodurans]|uniref:ABC transporter substrate-binding protein n=1 Tax=Halalkalibacterium halodurans TaxID=86665 RepID=UPI002E211275|nr:ABC transporter substrate-binding protein [Halalkalibacterium halodurans]MED4171977.1 ABC transporter substrate-binding protein [Halalkalibacterium halodurans]